MVDESVSVSGYPSVAILGSTGSVGEQAVDVALKNAITVRALCAGHNAKRVAQQARLLHPALCAMADENAAADLRLALADTDIRVYGGEEGILRLIEETDAGVVLNAIIGEAGLKPTLCVLQNKKQLALANKESLVIAGDLVMKTAREAGILIRPVDSEHCAIAECLRGGTHGEIKKILLTASGGPFFGYTAEMLSSVTVERALSHPTWKMGAKITIDSATLMNKGFEVIEASHLFGVPAEKIQVLVHRESIVHSAVEYCDHTVLAELSVPDMRLCVQYALTCPCRLSATVDELDLFSVASLTFARPDTVAFPLLQTAIDASRAGGALPAALNAANEEAVAAFLTHSLSFPGIADTVRATLAEMASCAQADPLSLPDLLAADREARRRARCIMAKNA